MQTDPDALGAAVHDDEIDLRELFLVLWEGRTLIAVSLVLAALVSVSIALGIQDKYTSEAVLSPRSSGGAGGLGQLASQFGGLAGLAGINLGGMGGNDPTALAKEMLDTRDFFRAYLYDEVLINLMAAKGWDPASDSVEIDDSIYDLETQAWVREVGPAFQIKPSPQEAHKVFVANFLTIEEDKSTGFVTVSITHYSPSLARDWVNLLVHGVNEAVRDRDVREAERSIEFLKEQSLKTNLVSLTEAFAKLIEEQTKTVMLANASDEYAFQVIEPPVAPERKSEPKRALICVLGVLLGGMLGVVGVLIRHYARRSPQAS